MIVEQIMTKNPRFAESSTSIRDVLEMMLDLDIRHLPITKDGELIGIVSDRDIREYSMPLSEDYESLSDLHGRLKGTAAEIMQGNVISVTTEDDTTDVIDLIIEHRIGAVPVTEPSTEKLVGIVSYIDVLKQVKSL